eukprot:TRINITY_DN16801_c0_g1_i1.p1 TRINITY_DN16801_c0_g1~~TRINITY_DN16801_c0_g1_i1.p1  ORF type:complete len:109 (-),score=26.34 TRINITY_DN16801_c0_g1_i1:35-361(-)
MSTDELIRELFNKYDTNKDGSIDAAELLAEFDLNKDGKVSFDEFKTVLTKYKTCVDEAALKQKFDQFDKDGDGKLDAKELLSEFDVNKDSKVSFDEFKAVLVKYKLKN